MNKQTIKQCIRCKIFKNIDGFYFYAKGNYYRGTCRECHNADVKAWRDSHRKEVQERDRQYYQTKNYKKWRAEYRKRPEILAKERAQVIKYRSQPDTYKKRREYLNRPDIKKRTRYLQNKRLKENIQIRLNVRISGAIRHSLKNGKQWYHWEDLVGYTVDDLKQHLEKQFKNGMSWDNYRHDGWHIDHIIPLKAFNFSSYGDIDFKRAWALDNLQPLWGKENMSKGAKLKNPFQPYLAIKI
jgi:hypothetical protein